MLDTRASGDREVHIHVAEEPEDRAADHWARARQRARVERPRMERVSSRNGTRPLPIHRISESEVGSVSVQFRFRHRAGGGDRWRRDQRAGPEPQAVPGSRGVEALGSKSKVEASYRLFMVPGMAHCGGGEGPNTFDMVSALEQWVEHGKAPDQIIASHSTNGVVDRTRPLCPYPQVAVYKGTGSIDDAANFTCRGG